MGAIFAVLPPMGDRVGGIQTPVRIVQEKGLPQTEWLKPFSNQVD
jgi:hypothetical protein